MNCDLEKRIKEFIEPSGLRIGKWFIEDSDLETWIAIWLHVHYYAMANEIEENKDFLIEIAKETISKYRDLFELEKVNKK